MCYSSRLSCTSAKMGIDKKCMRNPSFGPALGFKGGKMLNKTPIFRNKVYNLVKKISKYFRFNTSI